MLKQILHNPRHRTWLIVSVAVLLLILIYLFHSSKKPKAQASLPVVVSVAKTQDVPVYLSGLGSVIPTETITVKTQINGQLLQVLFRQGQKVKAHELLIQIDPRPYEAQLTQFEGQLQRDKALLANARLDLKRYQTLWKQDSVSKQVLDTQASLVQQLIGTVQLDQGQVDATKLNLVYCKITAPVAGRVGLRLVDPGNYVQTTDTTGLVVINTVNPITVIFSIPEDDLRPVIDQLYAGKNLEVKAYDRSQEKLLALGTLRIADNQVDPTTGTIKLRAIFKNEKDKLFPNQFVNIKLLINTLKKATVLPTAAIQHGSKGTYVYRIKNGKANVVTVKVGPTTGDLSSITSGISLGDVVVIEGSDKLQDGTAVHIVKNNGVHA